MLEAEAASLNHVLGRPPWTAGNYGFCSRAKENIGVPMTQEQVLCLEPGDIEKYYKRHETYVRANTTETNVNSFVSLYTRAVAKFVPIKDVEVLQNELKKDYITKELSTLVGSLALKCGQLLAVANTAAITTQQVDIKKKTQLEHHPSRDANGYPLDGFDEVRCAEQSAVTTAIHINYSIKSNAL